MIEIENEQTAEEGSQTVKEKRLSKWAGKSYQPNDPFFYHFTEGLSPYVAKYYLKFKLPDPDKARYSLFDPRYDGEIKGKLYQDFWNRPIKKDDYVFVFSKQDRGVFRVVNYRGARVIIEDESRGGRVSILPRDLFVVTDQIKANLLNQQARAVKMDVGYDNQRGQKRVIKAIIQ